MSIYLRILLLFNLAELRKENWRYKVHVQCAEKKRKRRRKPRGGEGRVVITQRRRRRF